MSQEEEKSAAVVVGKIEQVIRTMARTDPGFINEETRLAEDLGFDSLRLVELAIVLERSFGLPPLNMDQTLTVTTVGGMARLVRGIRSAVPS